VNLHLLVTPEWNLQSLYGLNSWNFVIEQCFQETMGVKTQQYEDVLFNNTVRINEAKPMHFNKRNKSDAVPGDEHENFSF